jgi:dihydrofolate reductase
MTAAREVKLYIAASLDGYIARADGGLDWLPGADGADGEAGDGAGGSSNDDLSSSGGDASSGADDHGYGAFMASVDTVLLGRATYEQVVGFECAYPYADKHSVVFTRAGEASPLAGSPPIGRDGKPARVTFTAAEPAEVVAELRREGGAHLWLCGGAKLCAAFYAADLVDELILFVVPVLLGAGIALFPTDGVQRDLKLVRTERHSSGMMQLVYRRR